jgi:hypothetical protein
MGKIAAEGIAILLYLILISINRTEPHLLVYLGRLAALDGDLAVDVNYRKCTQYLSQGGIPRVGLGTGYLCILEHHKPAILRAKQCPHPQAEMFIVHTVSTVRLNS